MLRRSRFSQGYNAERKKGIFEKYTNIKFQENPVRWGAEVLHAGGRIDKTDGDEKLDETNSSFLQLPRTRPKIIASYFKTKNHN